MCKCKKMRIVAVVVITVYVVHLLAFPGLAHSTDKNHRKKILVIYDRRNFFGFKCDEVTSVVHLFYHFEVTVDEIAASSYEKGMLAKYDQAVYIGIAAHELREPLLADLVAYQKPLLFIGRGIEHLIDRKYSEEVVFDGEAYQPTKVTYKGKEYSLKTERFFQRLGINSANVQVFSQLEDGGYEYPYVCRISDLWYVSCFSTDEQVLFYILADILHDFLAEYHTAQPQVYVRIEDVHCQRSPESLYEIADYLSTEDVPFMVALIPAFFDSERDRIYYLAENERFVHAIKYMQAAGGSILLHGYTHQIHKSMPGEGFEFWDGKKDCPLDVDIKVWVDERINSGINNCVAAGIFPLGFEAPHYAVSQEGYVQLKKYFSTIVGHLQTSDKGFTTTVYPYRLYNSPLYNQLLPENLGYVDPDDPLFLQHLLEELDKVMIVRDFTAGFFFHPYLDISLLKSVIAGLKQRQVQFLDLKQEENWVKGRKHVISSQNGAVKVIGLQEPTEESPLVAFYTKTVWLLVIVVTVICLRLFVILLRARKKSKHNLFKSEGMGP